MNLHEKDTVFSRLKCPLHLGKRDHKICKNGVKERTSVTIRICSVYIAWNQVSGKFVELEDESNCQASAAYIFTSAGAAPRLDSGSYLLKYVFVFLCVSGSVCECVWRDLGELLERYHRVGGGRWSVSERAVRTCCPVRLDSHPWNVSTQQNAPQQQPPIYTAIFHSLTTELNRICLPAVDTTLPQNFIHIQLISTSSPSTRKSNHWTKCAE